MIAPMEVPPQPAPDEDTVGFWQATAEGRLELCRCKQCRQWLQPPLERCPTCNGETSFEPVAGTGELYSFIVVHKLAVPGYGDQLPYVVALVELDEQPGLRLPGRLVGIDIDKVEIGQRVRSEIEGLPGGDFSVALFRPA